MGAASTCRSAAALWERRLRGANSPDAARPLLRGAQAPLPQAPLPQAPLPQTPLPLRGVWVTVAGASVGVGMVGVVVPLLPTTPFILLGAWAAARGSPRFHRWLLEHRVTGKVIRDWQRERRIPPAALAAAAASITLSLTILSLLA